MVDRSILRVPAVPTCRREARARSIDPKRVKRAVSLAPRSSEPTQGYEASRRNYDALASDYARAVERNRLLTQKYTDVVRLLQSKREEQSALRLLAAWALRTTSSGLALVHDEKISMTNVAFMLMDRPSCSDDRWEPVQGMEPHRPGLEGYPDLRALALGEARLPSAHDAHYRAPFIRGSQVLTVSIDRLKTLGSGLALVTLRDDTDLAHARASAMAAEAKFVEQEKVRTLGTLAMGVVHDLHNVLGSLAMRFDILERDGSDRISQSRNFEIINQIIQSCIGRVRTLHAVASPSGARGTTVDLVEVVSSAIDIVAGSFVQKPTENYAVHVYNRLRPLPAVHGASDQILHVLINLLINAREAMQKDGTITIDGGESGDHVVLAIEDDGPGIPTDLLERIFDLFFTTKGGKSTGVGLATAKRILGGFGGSIQASNLPAGGARFELRFRTSSKTAARTLGATPKRT